MLIDRYVITHLLLDGTRKHILGNMVGQDSVYGWFIYGLYKINSLSLVTMDVNDRNLEIGRLCQQLREILGN